MRRDDRFGPLSVEPGVARRGALGAGRAAFIDVLGQ